jgi:oligoribonuclease NrnB/cAMP/cGMP phosphodiesterase (DHH superfamily)
VIAVFFHGSCVDGLGAALAAYVKFSESVEYIPYFHSKSYDLVFDKYDEMYFLDCAPNDNQIKVMGDKKFKILDHHIGCYESLKHYPKDVYIFDNDHSGAYIAWNYFHGNVPEIIKYISDRDLWRFELPDSLAMTTGIYARVTDIGSIYNLYMSWNDDLKAMILLEGKSVLNFKDNFLKLMLPSVHKVDFAGYKDIPAINSNGFMSELGNILSKDNPFAIVYYYDGNTKTWKISFRSQPEGVNVAELAKQFFGGGHECAAGCNLKTLPWLDRGN